MPLRAEACCVDNCLHPDEAGLQPIADDPVRAVPPSERFDLRPIERPLDRWPLDSEVRPPFFARAPPLRKCSCNKIRSAHLPFAKETSICASIREPVRAIVLRIQKHDRHAASRSPGAENPSENRGPTRQNRRKSVPPLR